jgi:transcriptional regulator with XRE-family HTH domain
MNPGLDIAPDPTPTTMTPAQRFGANLRAARKAAGLTQEALAFRAEIHRTQITLYETGQRLPIVISLLKLAAACGVSPNDLLIGLEWMPGEFAWGRLIVNDPKAR